MTPGRAALQSTMSTLATVSLAVGHLHRRGFAPLVLRMLGFSFRRTRVAGSCTRLCDSYQSRVLPGCLILRLAPRECEFYFPPALDDAVPAGNGSAVSVFASGDVEYVAPCPPGLLWVRVSVNLV